MSLDVESLLDHAAGQGAGPCENAALQTALRSAFSAMEPQKIADFLSSDDVSMTLDGAFFEEDATGVEDLIEAARAHGEESDPDHEAGDLQAFLRAAFDYLDDERRNVVAVAIGLDQQAPSP